MKKAIVLAAIAIALVITMMAWSGILPSQYVSINAQLLDANDVPFPASPNYCLKFKIYSDASRTNELWSGVVDPVQVLSGGYITVTLGPIAGSVFDDGSGTADAVRFIQIWTCDDLLIGEPFAIGEFAQKNTATRTDALSASQMICLIDTHGDTVRCFPVPLTASSYSGATTMRINKIVEMLDARIRILEEQMSQK